MRIAGAALLPDESFFHLSMDRWEQDFFQDDSLHILVSKLLNCQDERVSDRDTKLDILSILANLVRVLDRRD